MRLLYTIRARSQIATVMVKRRAKLKFVIAWLFISVQAFGSERVIIGGDLLQSSHSKAPTEDVAVFLASQAAIRLLITECKIPHREIKIFRKVVTPKGRYYEAEIQAGISLAECEEGKKAAGSEIKRLSNPQTEKDQRTYDEYIAMALGTKDKKKVKQRTDLKVKDQRFDELASKVDELDLKLSRTPVVLKNTTIIYQANPAPDSFARTDCRAQANALMDEALTASERNTPPGNLAQGASAILYNRSLAMMAKCN